jgi:uncharacterized integral membrane protein (TIGR00697 family)
LATPDRSPKHLEIVAGLFTGLLIISNVCSNRLVALGPLEFDAGTLMFPLTYVFGDLLTEVYGFQRSRRVIWTGFLALALLAACQGLSSALPAPASWDGAEAFDRAMALTPRLALASLSAYLAGEFTNSVILARMKAARPAAGPAGRFALSTMAGQLVDTCAFASIAFLGVLDRRLWLTLLAANYVWKVGLELILMPATVRAAAALKRAEGLDPVDDPGSLSPFGFSPRRRAAPADPSPADPSSADLSPAADFPPAPLAGPGGHQDD